MPAEVHNSIQCQAYIPLGKTCSSCIMSWPFSCEHRCTASVRHQVRLEMTLGLFPLLFAKTFCYSVANNHASVLVVAAFAFILLVCTALCGWLEFKSSSFDSEDLRRSNDWVVCMAWTPILLCIKELLWSQDSEEIHDAIFEVMGKFLIFCQVLETPSATRLAVCSATFFCIAYTQLAWHFPPKPLHLTEVQLHTFGVHLTGHWIVRHRIESWCCRQTPLTAATLKQFDGPASKDYELSKLCPRLRGHLQYRRRRLSVLSYNLWPAKGSDAAIIISKIQKRRAHCKDLLIHQFLWKAHFHRQDWVTPEVLQHIEAFCAQEAWQVCTYATRMLFWHTVSGRAACLYLFL